MSTVSANQQKLVIAPLVGNVTSNPRKLSQTLESSLISRGALIDNLVQPSMVLVLIKHMLSPRQYVPIGYSNSMKDAEDGRSTASHDDNLNEKRNMRSGQAFSCRINPRIVSDATIGLSDGLTVPFALTAGLSALGDTKVVIYGGLAELIAGGISMGLGGYLGAKGESESFHATLAEVQSIVATDEERASSMARATFDSFNFTEQTMNSMITSLLGEPAHMVEFLMRFHHQLAETDHTSSRAYVCGLTISTGYFFGGLTPLLPYLVFSDIQTAFLSSIVVMALALFAFGWLKTALVGESCGKACLKNGLQMMMLGGVAAGAAMGCVKAVGS